MDVAKNIGIGILLGTWAQVLANRQAFVSQNLGLVGQAIQRCNPTTGTTKRDLYQAGVVGLCEAVDGFDPLRGNLFTTFAHWMIQKEILKEIEHGCSVTKVPFWNLRKSAKDNPDCAPAPILSGDVSMDAPTAGDEGTTRNRHDSIPSSEPSPEDNAASSWSLVALCDLARTYLARQNKVAPTRLMVLAYRVAAPLMGYDAVTLDAIGQAQGLTRERVRQVEVEVLESLQRRITP